MSPSLDADPNSSRGRTVIQYRPFNQTTGSDVDSLWDHPRLPIYLGSY